MYLDKNNSCQLAMDSWGWTKESCSIIDKFVFGFSPEIDTIGIDVPNNDGFVSLDDWEKSDASAEIEKIAKTYKSGLAAQSKRSGKKIEFDSWRIYPKVDRFKNILYYGIVTKWDNQPVLSVKISKFDRYGYVPFDLIPIDASATDEDIKKMIYTVVDSYTPNPGKKYSEFTSGDKVAAYGALGVFASLLGVKYGKAAATGLFAVALVLLKKLWFVLLLPLVWIGRLFKKK